MSKLSTTEDAEDTEERLFCVSQFLTAALAEPSVGIVHGSAIRAGTIDRRRVAVLEARVEIALDLFSVSRAGVELTHQSDRARAQPPRHLLPVGIGQLSHRPIALELFD